MAKKIEGKVYKPKGAHGDRVRHQKLEFDAKIANGPSANRSCTDLLCCLIFTAFLTFYVYVVIYGVKEGNPYLLVTPFDEDGKGCGHTTGYLEHKYIYFYDMTNPLAGAGVLKNTFCVSECPTYTKIEDTANHKKFSQLGITCKDTAATTGGTNCKDLTAQDTQIWFGRFCIIKFDWVNQFGSAIKSNFSSLMSQIENTDTINNWAKDTQTAWWVILASVGICLVISCLYMYILRCFADVVTWIMIFLLIALIIVGGIVSLKWAKDKQIEVDAADKAAGTSTSASTKKYITLMTWVGWILISLGIITVLVVLCVCHKIRLITAIIETTAHFINNTLTVLLVPIINTFLAIIAGGAWVVGTIYLYSVGELEQRADWPIANVKWTSKTRGFWYFNLFAVLWILAFILSLGDFIIAVACSIWYWNQGSTSQSKKKEEKKVSKSLSPVGSGYWWAFRYHLGSIAIGSFMIAIIWAIRLIMAYVHKKLKDTGATKNKFVDYLMKCIHCCLYCFERFVRFVNKQAFIYIGITGKSFFSSVVDAFKVVIRHPVEFSLLSGLGTLFMYMGIFVMVSGTVVSSYFIMKIDSIEQQLTSPFFPLVLIGIIAYFVSDLFIDIYMVACYAILHCYYVDLRLSKGNGGVPKNAPAELKKFLESKKVEYEEIKRDDSFDSDNVDRPDEEYK